MTANPHFANIAQNGRELLTSDGTSHGTPDHVYLSALSGVGREELSYGCTRNNVPTPSAATAAMIPVIGYCSSKPHVNDSYDRNDARSYVSFAVDRREPDETSPILARRSASMALT